MSSKSRAFVRVKQQTLQDAARCYFARNQTTERSRIPSLCTERVTKDDAFVFTQINYTFCCFKLWPEVLPLFSNVMNNYKEKFISPFPEYFKGEM